MPGTKNIPKDEQEWSAPTLIVMGVITLAAFFVFIYNVSP
jgi:hypothetical protein